MRLPKYSAIANPSQGSDAACDSRHGVNASIDNCAKNRSLFRRQRQPAIQAAGSLDLGNSIVRCGFVQAARMWAPGESNQRNG